MSQPLSTGKWAAILFAFTLVAFVVESQLTQVRFHWVLYCEKVILTHFLPSQYVQTDLGFRQPYFVL